MIITEQIETLLSDLQQKAEQFIREGKTASAVILLIYHDNIKKWLAEGQAGKPPVSANDLTQYGLFVPEGWVSEKTRLLDTEKLRTFPDLSPTAFQHPLDVQAVAGIQAIPLLGSLLKIISGNVWERQMWLNQISTAVRIGPNQGRSLYKKFEKAASILDLPELPEIYISNQYAINAYAFGIEKYQITLLSGLVDSFSDEELMAVIGHELGHMKCQHMLYKTMAYLIHMLGSNALVNMLPAGTGFIAAISLQLAILHWERMAEFSCDRAALLVVQDSDIVASALTKLAGGSRRLSHEIHLDQILQQAKEYEEADDNLMAKIFKVQMMLGQTHPFPIVRVKEIVEWAESEQYQQMMQGHYARMTAPALLTTPKTETAKTTEGKFCPQCQAPVFANWKRCPSCGSELLG